MFHESLLNVRDEDNLSGLHHAILGNKIDVVYYLLDNGIKINNTTHIDGYVYSYLNIIIIIRLLF